MSNPSGPDQDNEPVDETIEPSAQTESTAEQQAATEVTQAVPVEQAEAPGPGGAEPDGADSEAATEVFAPARPEPEDPVERRYTAPSGFDGSTQKIDAPHEPATEVFSVPGGPTGAVPAGATQSIGGHPKGAAPQHIPPRGDAPAPPPTRRSWGWVVAVVLVIAALVAVAVLGTVLLTRDSDSRASQEDQVRTTIENFDVAIQKGDLATLRGITCGPTRDNYVRYDDEAWEETHARVAAAKQYPVVASIDQVVVNGDHAEANVTTFMAYAPQTRSTRSFDLEFRDDQWKICQAPQ